MSHWLGVKCNNYCIILRILCKKPKKPKKPHSCCFAAAASAMLCSPRAIAVSSVVSVLRVAVVVALVCVCILHSSPECVLVRWNKHHFVVCVPVMVFELSSGQLR